MIQLLAKHQRKGALLLFTIFYLELALPAIARRSWPTESPVSHSSFRRGTAPDIWGRHQAVTGRVGAVPGEDADELRQVSPEKESKGDIGGPGQPEMSSFKSVNSNEMVDLFTGDFSYNIPLLDVGGYPVNIHYSSGVSMDQEASWVGLGWNINPGTISRSIRGLPDDFNGTDTISKTQSIKENKTTGVTLGGDVEIVGLPIGAGAADNAGKPGIGISTGVFHNTYNGWGTEAGINPSINVGVGSYGSLNAGLSLSSNSQTGINVQPSISFSLKKLDPNFTPTMGLSTNYNSRSGIAALQLNTSVTREGKFAGEKGNEQRYSASYSGPTASISFAVPTYTPSISMPYTSTNYSFRMKIGGEIKVVHPSGFVHGYVSKQEIKPADRTQKKPAVGFLYFSRGNDNINTLLDFNREKEVAFNANSTPLIAIPQYTYDVYSISGEGTGGMFRPYRGDIGFIRDHHMRSKSNSDRLSADFGFGDLIHAGVDYSFTNAFSENNMWSAQNDLRPFLKFRNNDTTYEAVYFRNPGERTTNAQSYYSAIGDDAILRVKLTGQKETVKAANSFLTFKNGQQTGELPVSAAIVKKQRDKRTQVISYLTAEEAALYGLDKEILSYKQDSIPGLSTSDIIDSVSRHDGTIRKKHHLSQITVLNGDGRRYVYGIPVYNLGQADVSFSVDKETDVSNLNKGLVSYAPGLDNTTANNKGKEGFFSKDSTPPHAHSFLLTGIVSSDYVDIRNDGITEDDMGDAVKFNYSRVYSIENPFAWRSPYDLNKANYNEGLKSYSRDDKGTYIYGKKEVWYLHSIESKTMVAVFKTVADRTDIYSVAGENGGLETSKKLHRLKQIDLYVKADLVKNGNKARPVKTVHFAYSYRLCKGVSGNPSSGKLTLDSIWFSYNGNEKGKLNPYVFRYHDDDASFNPSHNVKHYDRWGNYKDPADNPKPGMPNPEYPYAQQDSAKAAKFASVWTLNEILLPSGGRVKVTYEADDYAYVQNKRATRFFRVTGVGKNAGDIGNALYSNGAGDHLYVFIDPEIPLTSKQEIHEKLLEGNNYIYFKFACRVPADRWGGGNEYIPVYAEIEPGQYGIASGNRIWIKLKAAGGQSPLVRAALQFLRLNLPSKAYPNSEPGDNVSFGDLVKMLAVSFASIKDAFKEYDKLARDKGYCKFLDTTESFVRLNAPNYKKYGGGLRVKRVEVYDNWKKMTGQRESVYGQTYTYTKTEMIHGKEVTISSGVASYEPMIGAEENPFRTPIPYAEKIAPMAPVDYLFAEMPFGESFFPSASVGYSKVRVRTINAKAKSANGWSETEYFTTRDFPTLMENTILDPSSKKKHNPQLSSFLRINAKNYVTISQGFKIELNDMNGKVKAQASYAETDSVKPVSYVRNFYKVDNDTAHQKHLSNTVWVVDSLNGHINKQGIIGKDIEIVQDFREQLSKTISGDFGLNLDFFLIGLIPFPIPGSIPMPQKEEVRFRSSATVKIIQRYGILDSVVVMDKGSLVSTKNLVYDAETGEVVLSRTNNEFNDPIYNFSYPAHWAYSGMGMAYKNIDAIFSNLKLIKGKLYFGGQSTTPYPVERFFESGDEVHLMGVVRNTQSGANCLQFAATPIGQPDTSRAIPMKAWVIEASKAKEGDRGLYFIDGNGSPITLQVNFMRILRSGRRNLLDASVGSIVSMASPIKEVSAGRFMLAFDTTTRIINTSAVTYKDIWKTENFVFKKDTAIKVYRNYTAVLHPTDVTNKRYDARKTNNPTVNISNSKNLLAALDYIRSGNCHEPALIFTKSLITFDFSDIPRTAIVNSATLDLTARLPRDYSPQEKRSGCGTDKGYNWPASTEYYHGATASHLRRITAPWGGGTPYNGIITTNTNQTPINQNAINGVPVTALIQDMISQNSYGLELKIDKPNCTSPGTTEINFINFCSGSGPSTNAVLVGQPGLPNCATSTTFPCECTAPILTINYKVLEDSFALRCKNLADEVNVNPYKFGIFGNWRVDRAYTFYHDRKESSAETSATNIRKDGELKAFSAFWKFTDTILLPLPDTNKWVWNSASSLYSKKGFEIENYDPLGRYNAGLYGYNGTLPVAVAQNSRFRELLYDGFEDYGYKADRAVLCSTPRTIDFVQNKPGVWLTDTVSHTGLYSLKVAANTTADFTASVVATDTAKASLSFGIDSTLFTNCTYVGVGNGLYGAYAGYTNYYDLPCPVNVPDSSNIAMSGVGQIEGIDKNWGSSSPMTGMCSDWYSVVWNGWIQAPQTGNYTFHALSDRAMQVYINNVNVADAAMPNVESSGLPIPLQAGQLYKILVKYQHTVGNHAYARLRWSREGDPNSLQVVPLQYLYDTLNPNGVDTTRSSICNVPYYCLDTDSTKAQNAVNPTFSPLRNTKVVISAWVRMDGNDCNTAPALQNVVRATITQTNNAQTITNLTKTGVRIEGWQRYEAVVTLTNAAQIKLSVVAPSDRAVFMDDIRVQPYNSAMKSYAYNPENLRLMAELDENNYAAFYEYDDDGTLIRVKKETERGIMTIKESRSALVKNN